MGRRYVITKTVTPAAMKPIGEALSELKDMLVQLHEGIQSLNVTMKDGIQQSKDASLLAEKMLSKLGEKDESSGP